MRIVSRRDVWRGSALITALAVAVPTSIFYPVLQRLPTPRMLQFLAPAVLIPLFIALPISLFALNLVRLLTKTVDQVDRLVKFDALTGVMSRSYFMDEARARIADGGCLMMVDADFFKRINDTHGHDVGDDALKIIARALMQGSDPDALVGRLGGEEFGVCLPAPVDASRAARNAERIRASVRELGASIGDLRLALTVSIGIRMVTRGMPFQQAFKDADSLLYEAKRAGRDRYVMDVGLVPA